MLTTLLVAVVLVIGAAAAMHIAVNEKMQARPWRFLVPAITALTLAFFFQVSVENVSHALTKLQPGQDHLADLKMASSLLNIVVGAFSGGMIGAAVSMRAQILNAKKQAYLSASLAGISKELERAKSEVASIEADTTLTELERRDKADKAREIVILHILDKLDTSRELKDVSP
ncbi:MULTISPECIES: hypothetical protein [Luteimonas]|uniref:hypothetical protein n=1 Tax=Luteimonas TaxID=83614 RepID=UPI00117CCD96|nr:MULTISPECIES: hypothetical protein [Luteimonas]